MSILSSQLQPNIYTYCLRRGYETTSIGISYNQIKKELSEHFDITWDEHFELNFRIWFFDNFFEQEASHNLELSKFKHALIVSPETGYIPFERSTGLLVYLKGEA